MSKFIYPEDMDEECIPLCDFFNSIGLETTYSCCGHDIGPFWIMFSTKITEGDIRNVLDKCTNKYGDLPICGYFIRWLRKNSNQFVDNWAYMIPTSKYSTYTTPIGLAQYDLGRFKKFYENSAE